MAVRLLVLAQILPVPPWLAPSQVPQLPNRKRRADAEKFRHRIGYATNCICPRLCLTELCVAHRGELHVARRL
jgi:hypothetical protein